MNTQDVVHYLDNLLASKNFNDYAPNGLQVAGSDHIKKIITGVTASSALIDQAIVHQADAILVHHGYFWRGESPCITGLNYHRIKKLINHNINLIAYHLPLDCHPTLGNNSQLAKHCGFMQLKSHPIDNIPNLLWTGELPEPMLASELSDLIQQKLNRTPLSISTKSQIKTLAWCTGAAQDYIASAYELGADVYLSGEISERTTHYAREMGIDYLACGHHATERYGIKALGEHLAQAFDLNIEFIDCDNPV